MAGLNDLLNLSGSGLGAYQSQINVFGNNIANVNTDGYSRQTLNLEAVATGDGLGSGVRTGDVTRLYNSMGLSALLQEQSNTSYHSELASYLSGLETLVGSGSGGFDSAMTDFQTALQDVSASPEDLSARTTLLQSASTLATELNQLDSKISNVLSGDDPLIGQPSDVVDEVNSITTQLKTLNENITKAKAMGKSVPNLEDKRDSLVRELSKKVNVTVGPDYQVTLGGQELVSADGQRQADLAVDSANVFTISGVDVSASVTGGKLAAIIAAHQTAQSLSGQINSLASTLIAQTNAIFDNAYNLQGDRPVDLGYTFFTGTSAQDIAVDTTLYDPANPMTAQPGLVALANTANTGDNAAGQSIYDMLQTSQATLGNQSLANFWPNSEATLGGAVSEEQQLADNGQSVVDMLNNKMLSVSGVNMDEELTSLMGAQRAYQACARVMSTANSLLEEVINMTR